MSRARNVATGVAPTQAIAWHVIPDDDDRGPSKTFPRCADGDELLARVGNDVIDVMVERRHGVRFIGPDGEAVEPDAIATRPRRASRTQSEASRRASGRVRLQVRITEEQRRRLQWIQDQDGHDLSTIVGCHIDQEWEERNK